MIATFMRSDVDIADFSDSYHTGVRKLIDAKIAGEEIVEPKAIETPPVVGPKDALTKPAVGERREEADGGGEARVGRTSQHEAETRVRTAQSPVET